jgi:hypothetical protein
MLLSQYLFFFLSFVAVLSALMVILDKNPVHSVLYLIDYIFCHCGSLFILKCTVSCSRTYYRLCWCHHGVVFICHHDVEFK